MKVGRHRGMIVTVGSNSYEKGKIPQIFMLFMTNKNSINKEIKMWT